MNCKEFKDKYQQYTNLPLPREVWNTKNYEEWSDHMVECSACWEWNMEQIVINRGYKISDFPCIHIAYRATETCEQHPDPWDCPDIVLVKIEDSYGIPVRDGGSSWIEIDFCPWCGKKLKPNKTLKTDLSNRSLPWI